MLTVMAIALTVFYFYHDPATRSFGPVCLIHHTTGWYCWGCGGQRAFHALLHGDFAGAFQNNLLIYLILPILGLVLYGELSDDPRPLRSLRYRPFALTFLIFVITFTVIRNLKGFEFLVP